MLVSRRFLLISTTGVSFVKKSYHTIHFAVIFCRHRCQIQRRINNILRTSTPKLLFRMFWRFKLRQYHSLYYPHIRDWILILLEAILYVPSHLKQCTITRLAWESKLFCAGVLAAPLTIRHKIAFQAITFTGTAQSLHIKNNTIFNLYPMICLSTSDVTLF